MTKLGNFVAYFLSGWFILAFTLIVGAGVYFAAVILYFLLLG